ncbi:hypothetical protein [Corynebacterium sp.]|uniref:hypothetical protein n=1 Tax=Corynebacterium sp. TaxID=1720 RepID=UPI0025BA24BA|nr:hypothetical protein [Corynebacterium sp.]
MNSTILGLIAVVAGVVSLVLSDASAMTAMSASAGIAAGGFVVGSDFERWSRDA